MAESLQNVASEEVAEDGYISMYQLFSKKMNDFTSNKKTENKPWLPEDIEFWLSTAISLFIEFAGIGCIIRSEHLNQLKGISTLPTPQREAPTETEATSKARFDHDYTPTFGKSPSLNSDDDKKKRVIGFHADDAGADGDNKVVEIPKPCTKQSVPDIDNQMLGRYLTHIYSNIKSDNSIDGYQACGKALDLPVDVVRKLKNHCEHLQILESDSIQRKTFILKPKDEAFLSLGMK